jgi:hypothetical protein
VGEVGGLCGFDQVRLLAEGILWGCPSSGQGIFVREEGIWKLDRSLRGWRAGLEFVGKGGELLEPEGLDGPEGHSLVCLRAVSTNWTRDTALGWKGEWTSDRGNLDPSAPSHHPANMFARHAASRPAALVRRQAGRTVPLVATRLNTLGRRNLSQLPQSSSRISTVFGALLAVGIATTGYGLCVYLPFTL